ncbi:MAG: hypothetical protein Kow0022_03530 [Phycisphaerales bacterium]
MGVGARRTEGGSAASGAATGAGACGLAGVGATREIRIGVEGVAERRISAPAARWAVARSRAVYGVL